MPRSLLSAFRCQPIRFLGLLTAVAGGLLFSACDKKGGTKDWNTPGSAPPPPAAPAATPQPSPAPPPPAAPEPAKTAASTDWPESHEPTTSGLRFITYNVENWLTMDREIDRKKIPSAPKPEKERDAAARIVSSHQPDVLGICEIGTQDDLKDLQTRLKAAGLDLPHSHYTGGNDETRHLGLLSRFPITTTHKPEKLDYQLNGTTYGMNRGIMDATIEVRGKTYRFVGVHLKSQREVEEGDQAQMRLQEAHLLRGHVDSILAANPNERLVVYGDFNDNWGTPPLKAVVGAYGTPTYLTAIRAKDRVGVHWTHYWEIRDSYSRLDYITVSQALRKETEFDRCQIIDPKDWHDASDHRPVMAVFR